LANHKSAIKRNKQSLLSRDRNRANRTKVKNAVKKVDAAMEVEGSVEKAQEALLAAVPIIERAATKGAFTRRQPPERCQDLPRG